MRSRQISSGDISASSVILSRYAEIATRASSRPVALSFLPSTSSTALTASRFTSHSKGARNVSSKSLMSNRNAFRRNVGAEVHHVAVAAGRHQKIGRSRPPQIGAHDHRGAAQECECRCAHAQISDLHELRQPAGILHLQHRQRLTLRRVLRPGAVFRYRQRGAQRAAECRPLVSRAPSGRGGGSGERAHGACWAKRCEKPRVHPAGHGRPVGIQ